MQRTIVNATSSVLIKFCIHMRLTVASDFSSKMKDSIRVTAGASCMGYVKKRLMVNAVLRPYVNIDVAGSASVIRTYYSALKS